MPTAASFRERLLDFRSCWIVFIHVVRRCPGGLLQFSIEEAAELFLALFHLAFAQCVRTATNVMLGQQPKRAVAWLSISPHHSTHGGSI